MTLTKKQKATNTLYHKTKEYTIEESVAILKKAAVSKFDESVDIAMRLGVDPKKSDQMIRGTVSLPNGIGKTVRVLVLTKPAKQKEAQDAGADYVGFEEYIKKIQEGWTDIDVVIATPDVMGEVGKLGKILGTRGLMPNPKSGTVTNDVGKAVKEVKAGKISFRLDKGGVLHAMVGKASFPDQKLVENIKAFITTVNRMRPSSAKGVYIKGISISSTMGPGIRLDKALAASIH